MAVSKKKKETYTVKNASGGSMSYIIDGKTKLMPYPDLKKELTEEEIQDVYNSRGGRVLIEEDILMILDSDLRKDIANLEPLDKYTLDAKGFEDLFKKDSDDIENFLKYCSKVMLERIVDESIKLKVGNISTITLIEEYTGVNISSFVEEKIQDNKGKKTAKETNGTKTARAKKSDK